MSKVFICSDLHFSHKNIIRYENRPFADTEAMDKKLIYNWNSTVGKDDKVFCLGDVAFCSKTRTVELVRQLNGKKILVMGNHDRSRQVKFWLDAGFDVVSPYPIVYQNFIVMSHEPPEYFNENTPYFYLYGHVHGTPDYQDHTEHSACVCIERLNYAPALLDDVLSGAAYQKNE